MEVTKNKEVAIVKKQEKTYSNSLAAFYMVVSALGMAVMNFNCKLAIMESNITPYEIVYFRGLILSIMNLAYSSYIKADIFRVPKDCELYLWLRSIFGGMTVLMGFIGNMLLPISISNSLYYLYPIITSGAAYLFLQERMKTIDIIGMFSSFVGTICVVVYSRNDLGDDTSTPLENYIPSITAAVGMTIVFIFSRKLGFNLHFITAPIWFGIVQAIAITPVWLFFRSLYDPLDLSTDGLYDCIWMGVGGWFGQLFLNLSLQIGKAGPMASIAYIQIPVLYLIDIFYFKCIINWQTIFGSFLIFGCNFFTGFLEFFDIKL